MALHTRTCTCTLAREHDQISMKSDLLRCMVDEAVDVGCDELLLVALKSAESHKISHPLFCLEWISGLVLHCTTDFIHVYSLLHGVHLLMGNENKLFDESA